MVGETCWAIRVYNNYVGPFVTLPCMVDIGTWIHTRCFQVTSDVFIQASLSGRVDEVRSMKARVSNINGTDSYGWSALMYASARGYYEVALEILQVTAVRIDQINPDNGRTALMQASRNDCTSLVNLLLDRTARINNADNDGWTSLMLAAWKGNEQVVRTLIRRGADKTITNNHGQTAHAIALENGHAQIAQLLVV